VIGLYIVQTVVILTESPRFDVPYDCSVELSHLGYQFFTDIFMMFDKDRDGSLNAIELNDLFSTSPGNPWIAQKFPDTTTADETGAVTLQGWLAQWRYTRSLVHVYAVPQLMFSKYDNTLGPQDDFGVSSIPWLPRRFHDERFTGDETA
jgi:Ras family protein T1